MGHLKIKEIPHPETGFILDYLDKKDSVALLCLNEDFTEVLMVKQYRPGPQTNLYELPAGRIDEGEKPIITALRELKEETGFKNIEHTELSFLGSPYSTPGYSSEKIYLFFTVIKSYEKGEQNFDEGEFISSVEWMPIKKAKSVDDMKTQLAIYKFENTIKKKTFNQKRIIDALRIEQPKKDEDIRKFAMRMIEERAQFLKDYAKTAKIEGFVLGLSGGVDSFVASMLAKKTGLPLISIAMPYGEQHDWKDVIACRKVINPNSFIEIDIMNKVNQIEKGLFLKELPKEKKNLIRGNIKARTRMNIQYAYASKFNSLVIGTDHATEAVIGYYTKYGDGAADVLPLAGLTKDVIYEMAEILGVPYSVAIKPPSAGLWEGQNDEDELGIKYKDIITFLKGESIDKNVKNKIISRYIATEHKRNMPVAPADFY